MEMVETKALLENTPGSPTFKRRHIRFVLLGKSEIPNEIPFRRALAVAAAADAGNRGIPRPARVLDLLNSGPQDLTGLLIVFPGRGGSPRLVDAATFQPQPATVIDLDWLADRLRSSQEERPTTDG